VVAGAAEVAGAAVEAGEELVVGLGVVLVGGGEVVVALARRAGPSRWASTTSRARSW
jgi:hypothetical protein